mmetsp:Transcript_78344/g.219704  ORF Transcript_78344/g.219704 Transcript_78344/m.219704 type:complete len:256 (+) Transcript_78344:54-821(+)
MPLDLHLVCWLYRRFCGSPSCLRALFCTAQASAGPARGSTRQQVARTQRTAGTVTCAQRVKSSLAGSSKPRTPKTRTDFNKSLAAWSHWTTHLRRMATPRRPRRSCYRSPRRLARPKDTPTRTRSFHRPAPRSTPPGTAGPAPGSTSRRAVRTPSSAGTVTCAPRVRSGIAARARSRCSKRQAAAWIRTSSRPCGSCRSSRRPCWSLSGRHRPCGKSQLWPQCRPSSPSRPRPARPSLPPPSRPRPRPRPRHRCS